MYTPISTRGKTLELPISLAVLLLLAAYTYGFLVVAPHAGFYFNPSNGQIETVYMDGDSLLREGDVIEQIGDITLKQYKVDRRLVLYEGIEKGDVVEITVERNDELIVVFWKFPGFTWREFAGRMLNPWIVAYAFWIAGFAAQLSIRPRNTRRSLFIIANYLTALFLVSGNLSSWHLWESSTLLHMTTWMMMPVFLHFHWLFPRPLKTIPVWVGWLLYSAAFLLALGEAFHALGRNLYALGFIIAIVGSIALMVVHLALQKEERRTIFLLVVSIAIAFLFSIASAVAVASGFVFNLGWITAFSMPFMPLSYFYLIYRRQPGGMETRVNRFISTYAFLILLGLFFFIAVIYAIRSGLVQEHWLVFAATLSFITTVVTAAFLPGFQKFVDQRFFGIKLPYQHLPETYSGRIAASDDLPSLLDLLKNEVFPSLLVRQYAFLQAQGKTLNVLLAKAVVDDSFDLDALTQKAGRYLPNLPPDEGWLRLILPLKVGDSTLGFWLLGRRDPDDLYPQAEIPILGSLADQTAIALSSIVNADRLREYYRTELDIVGDERNRIARDLHETVLNKLADMRNSLDQKTLPPAFLASYNQLKTQLREIISNLRPPLLDQGLAFAVNEMVEDFREKNEGVTIVLDLQSGEGRLPEKVEEHLFHIAHEACENSLKHSECRTLTISGVVTPDRADLSIQDDGKGFDPGALRPAPPDDRHYGLTHMKERAHIIGAELDIRSRYGAGATVRVSWRSKE